MTLSVLREWVQAAVPVVYVLGARSLRVPRLEEHISWFTYDMMGHFSLTSPVGHGTNSGTIESAMAVHLPHSFETRWNK